MWEHGVVLEGSRGFNFEITIEGVELEAGWSFAVKGLNLGTIDKAFIVEDGQEAESKEVRITEIDSGPSEVQMAILETSSTIKKIVGGFTIPKNQES